MSGTRTALLTVPVCLLLAAVLGIALVAGGLGTQDSSPATGLCTGASTVTTAATQVSGLSAAQTANAQVIYDVSVSDGLPSQAAVIAIATAMQESGLQNISYGTSDSLGLFQQRPSQGWGSPAQIMQPVYAAQKFYSALAAVPGWQSLPVTVAAQDVQQSAYPNAYAQWQPVAESLVSRFSGQSANCATDNGRGVPASGSTHLPRGFSLPASTPPAVVIAIAYAVAQLGKPYVFSRGPAGRVMLNSRVCPAQKADAGNASGATGVVQAPGDAQWRCVAAAVVLYAAGQWGKPYQCGGTGPGSFDCSGLAMMAYRSAGIVIPRTSQQQWTAGPRVPPGQEQPGDLVFFAGADGSPQAPGHVGIVIGNGKMIEAYAAGYPVRVVSYGQALSPPGDRVAAGFTRP